MGCPSVTGSRCAVCPSTDSGTQGWRGLLSTATKGPLQRAETILQLDLFLPASYKEILRFSSRAPSLEAKATSATREPAGVLHAA